MAFVRSLHHSNFVCYRKSGFYQDPRLNCKNRLQIFETSGILFLIKNNCELPLHHIIGLRRKTRESHFQLITGLTLVNLALCFFLPRAVCLVECMWLV